MSNGAHGAIDSKISQNNLNPNNIKNQVVSETLDMYGLFEDYIFNQGTAIFNAQTQGGDNRFYKRGFSMPSTYADPSDQGITKEQIMQLMANSINQSPDDTVSTQSVQDLYGLHKQPMPKYENGGNVDESNNEWSGAEYFPEDLEWAKKKGINVQDTPDIMQKILDLLGQGKRPFTIGDNIYTPKNWADVPKRQYDMDKIRSNSKLYHNSEIPLPMMDIPDEEINKRLRRKYKGIIKEEAPHIAQWREEGMIPFVGKHLLDLLTHGGGGATYKKKGTHEYGVHEDEAEINRLNKLINEDYKEGSFFEKLFGVN